MADTQPPERDEINGYADELIEKIEESLAKHAEFERLYPLPVEAQVASDRSDAYTHG